MIRKLLLSMALAVILTASNGTARAAQTRLSNDSIPGQDAGILVSIGVESGDSLLELTDVSSAVRLTSGEIVVANSGTSQVRWCNSAGKFLITAGRRGSGPNEFGRAIVIFGGAADTVVALDVHRGRLHLYDRHGRFVRSDSAVDRSRLMLLHDRVIIERTPHGVDVDRLRTVARGIPLRGDELVLRVIPDARGILWVRPRPGVAEWTGYGAAGRVIATAVLPVTFEPFQITDTLVLGRDRDSLGVDRVQLRRFVRRAPPRTPVIAESGPRAINMLAADISASPQHIAAVRASLRNLVTANEISFSKNGRYAHTLQELGFALPNGMRVEPLLAGDKGYWFVATHTSLKSVCVLGVGNGWPLRVVECF